MDIDINNMYIVFECIHSYPWMLLDRGPSIYLYIPLSRRQPWTLVSIVHSDSQTDFIPLTSNSNTRCT